MRKLSVITIITLFLLAPAFTDASQGSGSATQVFAQYPGGRRKDSRVSDDKINNYNLYLLRVLCDYCTA